MPVITLDTSSVPAPAVSPTTPDISSIAIDGGTAPSGATIASGDLGPTLIANFNENAGRADIQAWALMGGLPAIIKGLVVTAATGLIVAISAGQAFIQGITEYAGGTKVLGASATTRIWLGIDGAIYSGTGAYVPGVAAIYLASVTTSGSAVTAVDTSGVFTMVGGLPTRQVNDTLAPTAPASGTPVHITKTAGGTYIWNGFAYSLLVPASAITTLSTGATTSQIVTYLRSLGLATS